MVDGYKTDHAGGGNRLYQAEESSKYITETKIKNPFLELYIVDLQDKLNAII